MNATRKRSPRRTRFDLYCLTYERNQLLSKLAKAEEEYIALKNEAADVSRRVLHLESQLDAANAAKRARYAELKYRREERQWLRLERARRSPAK